MTQRVNVWITIAAFVLVLAIEQGPAETIDFREASRDLSQVDSVWLAQQQVELARAQLTEAAFAGGYSLSLVPSSSVSADAVGVRGASGSASASFKLPTGLSEDAQRRMDRAARDLVAAEREVEATRVEAIARLYWLYQETWLAQEEIALLDAELQLARREHEIARSRFDEGELTLAQLSDTVEKLERTQTTRDQGTLSQRLTWLELAFAAGFDPAHPLVLEPELEFNEEPPKPPELSEWAATHDPAVAAQIELIRALNAELNAAVSRVALTTTKLQLSYRDNSLALSYAFTNPAFSATYSTPDLALYSGASSSGTSSPFSVGLSMTIAVNGARADELARAVLAIEIEREKHQLESLYQTLDFRIRSTYQQMHRARDTVVQAERALATATSNLALVKARAEVGRAGEVDLLEADIAIQRAGYNLTAALIARETSVMQAVLAASYFTEHYPHLVDEEGDNE